MSKNDPTTGRVCPDCEHLVAEGDDFGPLHMLRLGYQGIELMTEGEIFLPMKEDRRVFLKDVRRGVYTEGQVLALYHDLEAELITAIDKADLPLSADIKAVSRLVSQMYLDVWESRAT